MRMTSDSIDSRLLPPELARLMSADVLLVNGDQSDPALLSVAVTGPDVGADVVVPLWGQAVLLLLGAIGKQLLDVQGAVNGIKEDMAKLIAEMLREMVAILKKLLDEKFIEEHIRDTATSLDALKIQLETIASVPNPKVELEVLLADVSGFATALAKSRALNSDRSGLGIPGYVTAATLQLLTMEQLLKLNSTRVNLGRIAAVRQTHVNEVDAAVALARKAVDDSFALYGNYHGWVLGQARNFPPTARSLDTIDWNAEHPLRGTQFPAMLYLGVGVRNPYETYGWSHTEYRRDAAVQWTNATQHARSMLPQLNAGMQALKSNAQAQLMEKVIKYAEAAKEGWKRVGQRSE